MKMKTLFIPALALIVLSMTACTLTPAQVTKTDTDSPSWTVTTPSDATNLYAIASFPIEDGDIEAATHSAMQLAKLNLQTQIDKAKAQSKVNLNRTALEIKVRHAIQSQMNLAFSPDIQLIESYTDTKNHQVFVLVAANSSQSKTSLQDRLKILDTQLLDYLHTSQRGGELEQLFSLLPSLPTLEERAFILTELKSLRDENLIPSQDNSLAIQMNNRISMLFNNMIIGVSALTADTEKLELEFIKALNLAGLSISVRFPDLTLKYYIEPEITSLEKNNINVSLINDIEILMRDTAPLTAFNMETQATSHTESSAKLAALQPVANKISASIVEGMISHINNVNKVKHNR